MADTTVLRDMDARGVATVTLNRPEVNNAYNTGERFDALEARRVGLVHEVVPLAGLGEAGARVVDQLLQNAPDATAQTKAVALEHAWGVVGKARFARLVAQHAAKRQSAETAEGLASFREKRPARWYPGVGG
jgi:methylglutaconyl-CoA hydratase